MKDKNTSVTTFADELEAEEKTASKSANASTSKSKVQSESSEFIKVLAFAVILAALFRSLLFEPFHIPSGSMKNTLLVGDYLFVSKYAYGYSHYSFPMSLPLFKGRVLASQPKRGDVAVFRLPSNPRIDYIKRVIGLPGDTIQVIDGALFINGKEVPRKRVEDFIEKGPFDTVSEIHRYKETLPNGVTHDILDETPLGMFDDTEPYVVPEGHYFMMGDNRDNSLDSRSEEVGFVPEENLIGRAEFIFFSTDGSAKLWQIWRWIPSFRFERFFTIIH